MSFMAYWNGAYSGTSSNLTYCKQGNIIGSSNIGSQSVNYATSSGSCSGNAATATKAGYLDTGGIALYANNNDEINFGGTNTSSIIFFGYRATGSRPIPTSFIFGGSGGTATLTAGGFKKSGSGASYVLTGDGGHAAISSLSVNYANSSGSCSGNAATATNADTLDGYHASNLVKFYLSPMAGGAPADSATSWFVNTMPAGTGAIVYNVPGSEKTIIAGKSTGAYGHMLQLNYDDNYLRILRYYGGKWKTTDWEKVSAGYADAAGKWANARTITLTGSVTGSVSIDGSQNVSLATTTNHTHTFDSLTSKPTTISGYGIEDWVIKYADASPDTFQTDGIYRVSTTGITGDGYNFPYGQVLVLRGGMVSDTIAQIAVPYFGSNLYFRSGTISNFTDAAHPWWTIFTSGNCNNNAINWACNIMNSMGISSPYSDVFDANNPDR